MLEIIVVVFIVLTGGVPQEFTRDAAVPQQDIVVPERLPEATPEPEPEVAPEPEPEVTPEPEPAPEPDPAPETARTPEPQDPTGKFLNATEVRPILDATKGSWVAVRLYEGQDLLYFTSLLSWRCGLWEIRYGVNGAPADQVLKMEPCYVDTAQPAAMTDPVGFPIWSTFAPESVQSVTVEILYDDGSTDTAVFQRNQILIP